GAELVVGHPVLEDAVHGAGFHDDLVALVVAVRRDADHDEWTLAHVAHRARDEEVAFLALLHDREVARWERHEVGELGLPVGDLGGRRGDDGGLLLLVVAPREEGERDEEREVSHGRSLSRGREGKEEAATLAPGVTGFTWFAGAEERRKGAARPFA